MRFVSKKTILNWKNWGEVRVLLAYKYSIIDEFQKNDLQIYLLPLNFIELAASDFVDFNWFLTD